MQTLQGLEAGGGVGLRERRRLETRSEIHRAAVDLVLERGMAQVTVDDIAAAAGVSARTFFNYFPTKRDALVAARPPLDEARIRQFVAGSGDRLIDDLRDLLVDYANHSQRDRDEIRRLHQLIEDNPELSPLVQQRFLEYEGALAQAIAERLGLPSPTFEANVMAAICTALFRSASRDWMASDCASSLGNRLRDAFATVPKLL